jgi:hypothetical protein
MNPTVLPEPATISTELTSRMRDSRARATRWLLDHVDDDGTPVGAADRNGWARVPWALAMVGEREAGAAVLSWAERNALDDEFDFREGPARPEFVPVYPLAHLAYGAWLLERYDTALGIMGRLRKYQNPETGGATPGPPSPGAKQDVICTAQLGVTALVMGQHDVAEGVFEWLSRLFEAQPELPERLYLAWDDGLVTDIAPDAAFMSVVDFTKEKQAYFNPGMAAVFLAGYAMQNADDRALELGRRFLQLNIDGTPRQFDDLDSVQICKFGWGAAAMLQVERTNTYLDDVVRMAEWFIERQAEDGTWAPSTFMAPEPDDVDKLVKTAEHLMELTVISTALASRKSASLN